MAAIMHKTGNQKGMTPRLPLLILEAWNFASFDFAKCPRMCHQCIKGNASKMECA